MHAQRPRRWGLGVAAAVAWLVATAAPVPAQSPARVVGMVQDASRGGWTQAP